MPSGMNAHGTVLQRGDESTGTLVFTDIANVTNVSGPGIEREDIEVTHHKSTRGWREFIGGLKDAGEVSTDVNYHPDDHDALLADFDEGEPRKYRLVFPDANSTTWEFDAYMKGFEPEFPYDDKAEATITWKVTGPPNFDVGTTTP